MDLNHEFTVPVPVADAWKILTDVERIAPCLPGAELQEVEGDTYRGVVKVKVGPIQAQFKGQASFVERDDNAHKAVLKGEGRDTGGKGNASALITAQLTSESAASTKVVVTTDLSITPRRLPCRSHPVLLPSRIPSREQPCRTSTMPMRRAMP